jgi:hypothetical protein
MSTLLSLPSTADTSDDELREAIGSGGRASDAWQTASEAASAAEDAGPVVET